MVENGDSARKRAVECMTLANKTFTDERSEILRAMARSWVTLATQMDRLEAASVMQKSRTRSELNRAKISNGASLKR